MTQAPAGWFPAPNQPGQLRYWDGRQWTAHFASVSPQQSRPASPPPPTQPASPAREPAARELVQFEVFTLMTVLVDGTTAYAKAERGGQLSDDFQEVAFSRTPGDMRIHWALNYYERYWV